MQERERKWDTRHEDDKLWGAGVTIMIAKAMKEVVLGLEVREKGKEKIAMMDGWGLEASHLADTMLEKGQEMRQQLPQQPKPKLQLKLQPTPKPAPEPKPARTPARGWETVTPRAQSQREPVGPGPGPFTIARSTMAERPLIFRRDESAPLSNKTDQEIASAINRALLHQKAPAHIRIMNARRTAKGTINAIMRPNVTPEMALQYGDIIITAVRTFDKGVVEVEEIEPLERLKIHAVPLTVYMGIDTEGLQKMAEEFEAANEGKVIPTQFRWLENPRTVRDMRQNDETAASSVVLASLEARWHRASSRQTSRRLEYGAESKPTPMWAQTTDVSSVADGVTLRTSAVLYPHVATAQVICGRATIVSTGCDAG